MLNFGKYEVVYHRAYAFWLVLCFVALTKSSPSLNSMGAHTMVVNSSSNTMSRAFGWMVKNDSNIVLLWTTLEFLLWGLCQHQARFPWPRTLRDLYLLSTNYVPGT